MGSVWRARRLLGMVGFARFAVLVGLIGLLVGMVPTALAEERERVPVAVSFTVLADVVREVGGERVDVVSMTPAGAEVHEWELRPRNFRDLERAALFFYNGYGLEQWLRQVRATLGEDVPMVAVAEASGYPTQPIRIGEFSGAPDPHLWMDPQAVAAYAEVVAAALGRVDPAGEAWYEERAAAYQERLAALHEELTEQLAAVPEARRLLITSEAALHYFAAAYGFRHDGIWGSNAEEEGSPRQLMRVIDVVNERQPGALFWESTISPRYVRSVAAETGVEVVGPLYVDSLSEPDGPAATYPAMMRYNVQRIVEALAP
ncbi:metal ABC transporter solute-binding protein, Zn/Mn family [Halorhodospira abdelmalekii]|uniref:metal ABC transporter solute-binding protein, Zn/Mn family n=1 Tax=Halorhodospira abdelmalekii TaxID=421629 RepID=UPI0030842EB7